MQLIPKYQVFKRSKIWKFVADNKYSYCIALDSIEDIWTKISGTIESFAFYVPMYELFIASSFNDILEMVKYMLEIETFTEKCIIVFGRILRSFFNLLQYVEVVMRAKFL